MVRKFDRDVARELYITQHLTVRQIGKLLGVSGVAVWQGLKALGVESAQGEWVKVNCSQCGIEATVPRSRWRKAIRNYCSEDCRLRSMDNPAYTYSRQGQRLARATVSKHFTLLPGHVVHHEDSNTNNNVLSNLRVFSSHAEHMSYERGGNAKPIWDGRQEKKF